MIEYMPEEKYIIYKDNIYFNVLLSEYENPHKFQEAWHHKDTEERKGWYKDIIRKFKHTINKGIKKIYKIIKYPTNINLT